jgi:hypothetical protein
MNIIFTALGLEFSAEVDYIPETEDDNECITFDVLQCGDSDAMFLLSADCNIVKAIEGAACRTAEKGLKRHNEEMKLDAFIANHDFD